MKKLALILLTGIILTFFWGCSADDPLTGTLHITYISGEDAEFESLTSDDVELDTLTIDASVTWDNTTLEELLTFYGDNDLVLYAPLYAPSLQGSPFISKGIYHHTCTATGTTWGTQGRTFDNTDDLISIPHSSSLNPGTGNWTTIFWWYPNAINDRQDILTKGTSGSWLIRARGDLTAGQIQCYIEDAVGTSGNVYINTGVTVTAWNYVAVTLTKATKTFSITVNQLTPVTDSYATSPGSISPTGPLSIGLNNTNTINGVLGSILIYNRALSATEIDYIYEITKWRYGY